MARKRRGKGEGSIYRRGDGRWVGQYEVNGKRKYVSGKTRAEVAKKLTKAIAERDAGLAFDAEGLTVGEYLTRWLDTIRGTVKDNTWQGHEINVRVHLSPLGSTKLDKLNPFQVQSLYRSKLDDGQSPASVLKIHGTLSKALKSAVRWRLIPLNPCNDATPPRPPKANVQALEVQQVKTLLAAAEDTDLYALWVMLATSGIRIGEALALQWDDLNLDARTLRVSGTLTRNGIGSVKTNTSRRTIKLPKMTVDALREHHCNGSAFVFSTSKGTAINVCNLRNRIWKPLLVRASLPTDTHIHCLRHSAITLLLSRGVPVKVVSEMAGHAHVSITLAVYQSVLPHMQDGAADMMDETLS